MPNLDQEIARQRLASVPVVRLATADEHGRPHIVATTFAVEGDQIFMAVDHKPKRSRNLKRLRNIHSNGQVSVLADHYEDDWGRLWWVRADGNARIIEDPEGMRAPIDLLQNRYPQYRETRPEGPVIAIDVSRWSGWAYSDEEGTSIT